MWGCNYLGWMYEYGKGVDKNLTKAVELYKKACKGKYYYACINLGFLYRDGRGVEKNSFKALELFKRACKHGSKKGCQEAEKIGIKIGVEN